MAGGSGRGLRGRRGPGRRGRVARREPAGLAQQSQRASRTRSVDAPLQSAPRACLSCCHPLAKPVLHLSAFTLHDCPPCPTRSGPGPRGRERVLRPASAGRPPAGRLIPARTSRAGRAPRPARRALADRTSGPKLPGTRPSRTDLEPGAAARRRPRARPVASACRGREVAGICDQRRPSFMINRALTILKVAQTQARTRSGET
jgi:hypothetical protein